jgi:hypothetical protein
MRSKSVSVMYHFIFVEDKILLAATPLLLTYIGRWRAEVEVRGLLASTPGGRRDTIVAACTTSAWVLAIVSKDIVI